jgi:hypothetical protein
MDAMNTSRKIGRHGSGRSGGLGFAGDLAGLQGIQADFSAINPRKKINQWLNRLNARINPVSSRQLSRERLCTSRSTRNLFPFFGRHGTQAIHEGLKN